MKSNYKTTILTYITKRERITSLIEKMIKRCCLRVTCWKSNYHSLSVHLIVNKIMDMFWSSFA